MADVRAVLQRCDPSLLDQQDATDADRMLLHLADSRRVQKVLWRQLSVLDSMMSVLEELKSARQLMMQTCPPQLDGGARSRWKALKLESRAGLEDTELLLRSLQDKVEQIGSRRRTLEQLVQQLQEQKRQSEHVEESLRKAQNALRLCDRELTKLRAESETVVSHLTSWQHLRDELQDHVSAIQDVMQINLLSFGQSALCVELRPRPSNARSQLVPLKLSVSWSHDELFTLQVDDGTAGLAGDCVSGRRSELSAALLEVMQRYIGQAELLSEVQSLRSSFAIDWRPAQRLLVYLKSASVVCHLEVEDGYPGSGKVRLLSVRRDGRPLKSELKPHKTDLSLTDWLVFLCSSPLV